MTSGQRTSPVADDRRLTDLAMLGHELRNPLAAAFTGVATAAVLTPADDTRAPLLERACRDLERLSHLLNAYLELLGGRLLRPVRVDVGACVRGVATRRAGAVTARVGASPFSVSGSAILLERAIENLVDNALHSGAKRVEIATTRRGDKVHVEITDDGPGVAPALRDRLFDPFVSGRGSTGLGLVLVRDIAAAHGGTVRLDASPAGARFNLTLPLLLSDAIATAGAGA